MDLQREIQRLGLTDALTGLSNRGAFEEQLKRLDAAGELPLSLIMLDLNGLKLTNDLFGHAAGDRLLQVVAQVLRSSLLEGEMAARLGGDEFGLILPGTDSGAAEAAVAKLRQDLAAVPQDLVAVSAAFGAATKAVADDDIILILREAESRMYDQKMAETDDVQAAYLGDLERLLAALVPQAARQSAELQAAIAGAAAWLDLPADRLADLGLLARTHHLGLVAAAGLESDPGVGETEAAVRRNRLVEQHPAVGYRIARALPNLAPVADAIFAHHERWDGTGRPRGLAGEQIPLAARALAVIDAYLQGGRDGVMAQSGLSLDPDISRRLLTWTAAQSRSGG